MKHSKHVRLEELLVGQATDKLTSAEEDELKLLLSDNKLINDNQDCYQLLINNIKLLPSMKVPTGLKGRVLASCQKEESIKLVSILKTLLIFFAGFSGLLLIGNNNRNFQIAIENSTQPPSLSNQKQQSIVNTVFKLSPPSDLSNNSQLMNASLVIRPNQATNLLKIDGLPPLQAGLTYRLWAYTNKGPQGCVSFHPNDLGQVNMQVPSEPTKSALSVSINIDQVIPGSGPNQPGTPVLTSI